MNPVLESLTDEQQNDLVNKFGGKLGIIMFLQGVTTIATVKLTSSDRSSQMMSAAGRLTRTPSV